MASDKTAVLNIPYKGEVGKKLIRSTKQQTTAVTTDTIKH